MRTTTFIGMYTDIDGKPIARTPVEYPYSHDPYLIFKAKDFNKETDRALYSDCIIHYHYSEEEINAASEIVQSKHSLDFHSWHYPNIAYVHTLWNNPKYVEEFLSILMKKEVKCTAILRGVYFTNGYPIWTVYIR